MRLTSAANILDRYFLILFILGFVITSCHQQTSTKETEKDLQLELIKKGSTYIKNGNYDQAHQLYSRFVADYSIHPYVDDAAYRLAYISVIVDENNPYFNYKNGLILFQNFIENYPNSRYIIACQNWINLLSIVIRLDEQQSAAKVGEGNNSSEINRLRNELKRVQAENANLKNTLEELQKAIER